MKLAPISVLMATHRDESATNLATSLQSLLDQTLLPQQVVLVLDGPVDDDQERVIKAYSRNDRGVEFTSLRLPDRQSLATALNAGLRECRHEIVARMDSDDISAPHRLETQWRVLSEHGLVDVLGSWHAEFREDPRCVDRIKTAPELHDQIVRALKWRSVVSHPTIMFRRSVVLAAGGYDPLAGKLEDYDLFMRLVASGARFHVVQESLLWVRVTRHQRMRRGGVRHIRSDLRVRYRCYRRGTLTGTEFLLTFALFTAFRLAPWSIKSLLYRLVRKRPRGLAEATVDASELVDAGSALATELAPPEHRTEQTDHYSSRSRLAGL